MNLSAITSFVEKIDPLSMNNSFESSKFESEPMFENTINQIKVNYLKIIYSTDTNTSAITSFDEDFYRLCMNSSFEAAKFEPEPTFEKNINDIKYNHSKVSTSLTWMYQLSLWTKPLRLLNIKNKISCYGYPYKHNKNNHNSPIIFIECTLMQTPKYKFENCGFLLDQHYIFSLLSQTFFNTSQ